MTQEAESPHIYEDLHAANKKETSTKHNSRHRWLLPVGIVLLGVVCFVAGFVISYFVVPAWGKYDVTMHAHLPKSVCVFSYSDAHTHTHLMRLCQKHTHTQLGRCVCAGVCTQVCTMAHWWHTCTHPNPGAWVCGRKHTSSASQTNTKSCVWV